MKTIFFNVDTQKDFIEEDGKLAIPNAVGIKSHLKEITKLAKDENIQVINTADWHKKTSEELSDTPDFVNTFPEHCMRQTDGANFIDETHPNDPDVLIVNWDQLFINNNEVGSWEFPTLKNPFSQETVEKQILESRNIVIRKDKFDVFAGNMYTNQILEIINPDQVIVYGVATNVCVDFAVRGLATKGYKVYVVMEAIKELPQIPMEEMLKTWQNLGVKIISKKDIKELLNG